MRLAPVQVLVLVPPNGQAEERLGEALAALGDGDSVRLLDVLRVTRMPDGSIDIATPDIPAARAWLGKGMGASIPLFGQPHTSSSTMPAAESRRSWSVSDAVGIAGSALIALIEHRWAAPLHRAMTVTRSFAAEEAWLSGADLARLAALMERRTVDGGHRGGDGGTVPDAAR